MGRRAIFAYAAQATNHAATARRIARVSEAAPRPSYAAPRISWTRSPMDNFRLPDLQIKAQLCAWVDFLQFESEALP